LFGSIELTIGELMAGMRSRAIKVFGRLGVVLAVMAVALPVASAQDEVLKALPFSKKLKLAKAGDDEAKLAVGMAFELGEGTTPDIFQAAKWYRESALTGNIEAQYRLATILMKGAPTIVADKVTALKLFQYAAAKNHAASLNSLGMLALQGEGMGADAKLALANFEKAANLNNAWGQNNLGAMHEKGWGTPVDLDKAQLYYQKSADAGLPIARDNLARLIKKREPRP
jgi:uncharacterized protein